MELETRMRGRSNFRDVGHWVGQTRQADAGMALTEHGDQTRECNDDFVIGQGGNLAFDGRHCGFELVPRNSMEGVRVNLRDLSGKVSEIILPLANWNHILS
jgi:hypothetical protein